MKPTAERIFYLLKSQNKSQTELANYLGISKQTVSGWKNPKNVSYNDYIKEISEFLDVTVDCLIGDNLKGYKAIENPQEVREKIIGGAINTALEHGQKVEVISVKATAKEWFEILSKLSDDNLIKLKEYAELLLLQQAQASQK